MKTHCQPCKGKSTEIDCSTCTTALLKHIEQREFELGVAPDDAYVKPQPAPLYLSHMSDTHKYQLQALYARRFVP